jgi:malic enzyme
MARRPNQQFLAVGANLARPRRRSGQNWSKQVNVRKPQSIKLRGQDLIREPLLNKGSAFSLEERRLFGLDGLLPNRQVGMQIQAQRTYESISRFEDPLEKYVALASLQDRNEHLYFHLLATHLEEFMPIVYTPTVALATREFSHVFQRGRGVWITPDLKGRVAEVLRTAGRGRVIELIVATDNESILGIGDQGAGGMAISIGKLALYTAGAGIDPAKVLPVSLDVGTDNAALLDDPMYLGWPQKRLRGTAYRELLDEFVEAVRECWPYALVQWEDFRKDNALAVLDRYQHSLPSFNDDIQGTGATALAGVLNAGRISGRSIAEERIVILGAGAAGLGISRSLQTAFKHAGLRGDALTRTVAVLDSRGLIVDDGSIREHYKKDLAWSPALAEQEGLDKRHRGLDSVVAQLKPTVLIGTSGQRGAFTRKVVQGMAAETERPVIMPLSNPTDQSEATPSDLYEWTDGRALVATGSPFPEVVWQGHSFQVGQGNNMFIFPAVGLGVLAAKATAITDELFNAAAAALADCVTQPQLEAGLLYPPMTELRQSVQSVATAIYASAIRQGLCDPVNETELQARLQNEAWEPVYREYRPG